MKQIIYFFEQFKDELYFLAFVSVGIFNKVYEAMKKGKKFSLKWILAEAIISFFVAVSVWAVCDQFLQLNKILTYVICAWAGKSSAIFSEKIEEIIEEFFKQVKSYLKIKKTNE